MTVLHILEGAAHTALACVSHNSLRVVMISRPAINNGPSESSGIIMYYYIVFGFEVQRIASHCESHSLRLSQVLL